MRFLATGGVCAVVQLALLAVLLPYAHAIGANVIAFLLSAQLNFAISQTFTWRDRDTGGSGRGTLARRWLTFHATIATTFVLNMTVFALAQLVIPHLPAAALGILAASAINFLINDRWTFRASGDGASRE